MYGLQELLAASVIDWIHKPPLLGPLILDSNGASLSTKPVDLKIDKVTIDVSQLIGTLSTTETIALVKSCNKFRKKMSTRVEDSNPDEEVPQQEILLAEHLLI